jgi:hypothetical protein
MPPEPKPSRYQDISADAQQMLTLGESGRYEFKRDAEAVTVKLLAALANWVAVDSEREVAHLLVGVDEVEDSTNGLVRGEPFGLPKGLDRAVSRIQDLASKSRPVPIDVFIVEENVAGDVPFVRVEIRPTMPPHFDDEGRRQTRQGRSTRALTDEELLHVYLNREAGSFAARFRQTTEDIRSSVGVIGGQVEDIATAIEATIALPIRQLTSNAQETADAANTAASAAYSAEASASNAEFAVANVEGLVGALRDVVDELQDETPEILAYRVSQERRKVWWSFTTDTWPQTSTRADRLEKQMRELLDRPIVIDAARNSWEVRIWRDLLEDRVRQRHERGTQAWWGAHIQEVIEYMSNPIYASPELPDLRAALKADFDNELDDPQSVTRRFEALMRE